MLFTSGTVVVLVLVGAITTAAAPTLVQLDVGTVVTDLSADGLLAVGSFGGGGFRWTAATGVVDLGGTGVTGVSADGTTLVGTANDANGIHNAAVWLKDKSWRLLGSFNASSKSCDSDLSSTFGVSGTTAVGLIQDGCKFAHAGAWSLPSGAVRDLGSMGNGYSRANGISEDGSVIFGWQDQSDGERTGAMWNTKSGVETVLKNGAGFLGEAQGCNADCSFMVGGPMCEEAVGPQEAWVRDATGTVKCLPVHDMTTDLVATVALTTSTDGRVVGGQATSQVNGSQAWLWLDGKPVLLIDHLKGLGVDVSAWTQMCSVTSMSDDMTVLGGFGFVVTTNPNTTDWSSISPDDGFIKAGRFHATPSSSTVGQIAIHGFVITLDKPLLAEA
jgi:uncharacterized membrane protein